MVEQNKAEEVVMGQKPAQARVAVRETLRPALVRDPEYLAWIECSHGHDEVPRMMGLDPR